MDFLEPDDYKCDNYYTLLKNTIIFSKLLKANDYEQTVQLINFPFEEKILIKEFAHLYPLTKNLSKTLKKAKPDFFWTFLNWTHCIITFKPIMNITDCFYINIKKF